MSKNQRERLEKRIAAIEKEIPLAEARLESLTAQMSLPEVSADFETLQTVTAQLKQAESRIQSLYDEWEAASEQLK